MPIYVYRCVNGCGQEIEKISLSATPAPDGVITVRCANCGGLTRHLRAVTAPHVQTPQSFKKARSADYRRSNPNWKANVLAGKTADGRPRTNLQQRSAEQWGQAFSGASGQNMQEAQTKARKYRGR